MMSTGIASGTKVLDGALRSCSADAPDRMGEVDLPREGIVFP